MLSRCPLLYANDKYPSPRLFISVTGSTSVAISSLGFSGSLDSIKGISGTSGMLEHPARIINALIYKVFIKHFICPQKYYVFI